MSDPRKLLVCLLDYIKEQAKEINPKGYRLTNAKGFIRQRNDIMGLPGVEFDLRVEGDHVWLRVPRLTAEPPPDPPNTYASMLRISLDPNGPLPSLDEPTLTRQLNHFLSVAKRGASGP